MSYMISNPAAAAATGGPVGVTGRRSYRTVGASTFTVPAGVYLLKAFLLGGGGGAGGPISITSTALPYPCTAGSGGGGWPFDYDIPVSPGDTVTITVGAGGAAGTPVTYAGVSPTQAGNGSNGGDTTIAVNGALVAYAYGGAFGGGARYQSGTSAFNAAGGGQSYTSTGNGGQGSGGSFSSGGSGGGYNGGNGYSNGPTTGQFHPRIRFGRAFPRIVGSYAGGSNGLQSGEQLQSSYNSSATIPEGAVQLIRYPYGDGGTIFGGTTVPDAPANTGRGGDAVYNYQTNAIAKAGAGGSGFATLAWEVSA